MEIELHVIRCPEGSTPETRRSAGADLVIGRGADCDWVLPDHSRHLSKRHCAVELRGGFWHLRDLSTNGTFVNRAGQPIGRDRTAPLQDGDRIRLGEFEIEVRIRNRVAGHAVGQRPPGDPAPDFGWPAPEPPAIQGLSTARPVQGMSGDPPWLPPALPELPDLPSTSHGSSLFDGPAWPPPPPLAPAPVPPHDVFEEPDSWLNDPLRRGAGLAPTGSGSPPPTSGHFEDWPPAGVSRPPLDSAPGDFGAGAPMSPPPLDGVPPPATGAVPLPVVLPSPAPRETAVSGLEQRPQIAPAAGPGAEALLAALLDAAGVPAKRLPAGKDPVADMRTLGAVLGTALDGLRGLLAARSMIKRDFRIEQTILGPSDNNTLKFGDRATALPQLLADGEREARAAVQEVVEDLRIHELATIEAMQAAGRALLDRLSPDALETEASRGGLDLLAIQRRARLWEDYQRLHAKVAAEFGDNFDSVFGKAFARAYQRVAAARRGPDT